MDFEKKGIWTFIGRLAFDRKGSSKKRSMGKKLAAPIVYYKGWKTLWGKSKYGTHIDCGLAQVMVSVKEPEREDVPPNRGGHLRIQGIRNRGLGGELHRLSSKAEDVFLFVHGARGTRRKKTTTEER